MADGMAVQVTIYLNESDQWHHRPLHAEILKYLREENVYAATALHAVAGFLGRQQVKTSHLVDAGGQLPVIIIGCSPTGAGVTQPNGTARSLGTLNMVEVSCAGSRTG